MVSRSQCVVHAARISLVLVAACGGSVATSPGPAAPAAPASGAPADSPPSGPASTPSAAAPPAPAATEPAPVAAIAPRELRGVTATEIKIGQTAPYTGPASAYGVIGKVERAYFQMVNDAGGVNGRKLTLLSEDDGYNPARTVEQTRRLVEVEGVALMFGSVGHAPNWAVRGYLEGNRVPQLFVGAGAELWADPTDHPSSMGFQPSYRVEGRVFARYLVASKPRAKVCVLYQSDSFGEDYRVGFREALTDEQRAKMIALEASYDITDPSVDAQIKSFRDAGCDTLLGASTPRTSAFALRAAAAIGWRPVILLSSVSTSISAVFTAAGLPASTGVLTGHYLRELGAPASQRDPQIAAFRQFMAKYSSGIDPADGNAIYGYVAAAVMVQVLTQCGDELSPENLVKQAANLQHLKVPMLLDGIEINTSSSRYRPVTQLQMVQFNGRRFVPVGQPIDGGP